MRVPLLEQGHVQVWQAAPGKKPGLIHAQAALKGRAKKAS